MVRRCFPFFLFLFPCQALAGAGSGYPVPLACSADVGEANVNEIKSKGGGVQPTLDFAEFKVLQDNVDITGWQICGSDQPGSIECFDIGTGDGTWYTVTQTAGEPDDSQSVYNTNTWITYDFKKLKAEEGEVLLLDEFGNVMDYIRWSNQADICTSTNFSWDVPDACGSCFDQRDPNQKDFARGPDGTGGWGNNGDEPSEGATNDEEVAADHFAIIHDGGAVNCQAEPVTIEAHTAAHSIEGAYAGLITFDTSTLHGDWTGIAAGGGTLTNNGNGSGSYQFIAADGGQVTLLLADTFVETLNINVTDGAAGEAPAEDPDLVFARSGFAFRVNGAPGLLPEQIAGKPSNTGFNAVLLELEAIDTNDDTGACEALLTGNVNIDLAAECQDPATCSFDALVVNGVAVAGNDSGAVGSYTTVPLDFGDALDTTAPLVISYNDVGAVTLHAALAPAFVSGETLNGSTNITVRPFGFDLAVNGGAVSAVNPAAFDANGAVFTTAGADFNVDVRAVGWQAGDDQDNDGIPDGHGDTDITTAPANLVDNAATPSFGSEAAPASVALNAWLVSPDPATAADPGLAGVTTLTGFVNGSATATALRFDEVGIIEIIAALGGGSYFGGQDVAGASGRVGRFVPAYFDVDVVEDGCDDAGGYTYSGQNIGNITVTARAGNGSATATVNYDGLLGFSRNATLEEGTGASGSFADNSIPAAVFESGVATLQTISFRFDDPETAATDIQLRALDADGVTSAGALEEGTEIRSGRLAMFDAQAITITDGRMRLEVQTWQDAGGGAFDWAPHLDDTTCTVPQLADFTLDPASFTSGLQSGETAATTLDWSAGSGSIYFSAPGSGNAGSVTVNGSTDDWLQFDWNGAGLDSPSAKMSFFEIFESEEGLIDQHEILQ